MPREPPARRGPPRDARPAERSIAPEGKEESRARFRFRRGSAERRKETLADRDLDRYRKLCRRSRELALARAASGVPPEAAEADQAAELALERWHAARRFERRLKGERKDAEVRGSVVLASEIDRLLAALDGAVAGARRLALEEVTRATANVVSFERRSA